MYVKYRPLLLYLARRKFEVPEDDCEPLVQEALLSLLTTGTTIDNPKGWLIGAVCNASRHYWRERARVTAVEAERVDHGFDVPRETEIETLERQILIRSLLARLGSRQREVLRLHYFEGKTAPEVADALGTTPRYAQKLIGKALATMRTLYERQAAPIAGPRREDGVREGTVTVAVALDAVRPRRRLMATTWTRV